MNRPDPNRITKRWKDERKISATDVNALIAAAEQAISLRAANDLRNATGNQRDALSKLFGGFA